jgi:hypothetical protein
MSALRKRLLYIGGTVTAATAAIAFAAAPASAGDGTVRTKYADGYLASAGTMNFTAYGDILDVCDNSSDGAGVRGYWSIGAGGTVHSFYNGGGYGSCATEDHDFSETAYIYIDVCISNDGVVDNNTCSGWNYYYAGNN